MRAEIEYLFLLSCFKLLICILFNDRCYLSVSRSKATHTYGLDCDESAIPVESGLLGAVAVFQVFCGFKLTGWR